MLCCEVVNNSKKIYIKEHAACICMLTKEKLRFADIGKHTK